MNSGYEKNSEAGKGDSLRKKDKPGVFLLLHHIFRAVESYFSKNILIHSADSSCSPSSTSFSFKSDNEQ